MAFNFFKRRGREEPEKAVAVPAPAAEPVVEAAAQEDTALIAVITAAIAAILDGEKAPGGFIVRHVRRVSNAPLWQRAGREEQTYSRF